jgi:hypothetical protein
MKINPKKLHIAKRCGVSGETVRKYRPEAISQKLEDSQPRKATRNGTTYAINTANIGKSATLATPAEAHRDELPGAIVPEADPVEPPGVAGQITPDSSRRADPSPPDPEPVGDDERRAEVWFKIIQEYCILSQSVERRGGMAVLAARWPQTNITDQIETCLEISEIFQGYAEILGRLSVPPPE